jgi:putative tryptophan/tyrosine transport system substrate-binding protein
MERVWIGSFDISLKSAIRNLKSAILLGAVFLALCVSAAAQQAHIPRIGYLAAEYGSSPPKDFVQALRDLGYVEGKNIAFEYRTSEGKTGAYPDLLADLIRIKVDIIVTSASGATLAAKKATSTIPIVMTSSTDPVGTGLVASLARPGGNITGLTSVTGELGGKFLELLKEIVPRLSRVLIPAPAGSITEDLFIKETEGPARALKVQTIRFPVRGPEDYESIFRAAANERANGLVVRLPPSSTPASRRKQFTELAAKNRLPAIYGTKVWVESGGLVSYGQDQNMRNRRLATYVDKILKGAKPADLPIEAPTKFEFVINLKTAKQIGLTIPPNVLARADKVIK